MQTEREKEIEYVEKLKEANPDLFVSKTKIEDGVFLSKYGIKIENKKNLPCGYLKFLGSDFIVEEFDNDGIFHNIDHSNIPNLLQDNHKYISATLVKCAISTIDFENIVTKKIPGIKIGYAGIKDKKAITSQKITFQKEYFNQIKDINHPNFFMKNFVSCSSPINIGNLKSNLFTIAIRFSDIKNEQKELIIKKLEEIARIGFKNYFYLQRFGSPRFIGQELGLSILNGNFKEAVYKNLFKTSENELDYFKNHRNEAEKCAPDWKKIQSMYSPFPTMLKTENDLINQIIKNNGDFEKAILGIRDQMQIWIYAFASLLFNYKISGIQSKTKIPLPFSSNPRVHNEYSEIFRLIGFNPQTFNNLKKYNFNIRDNYVDTFCEVKNLKHSFDDNTLIVSFELGKGSYATSLLANIFNEIIGDKINFENTEILNIKRSILGGNALDTQMTLDYFNRIINEPLK